MRSGGGAGPASSKEKMSLGPISSSWNACPRCPAHCGVLGEVKEEAGGFAAGVGQNQAGGYHLSWNGDTLGVIVCSRCSRKWQYAAGQVWRLQIKQKCSGTTEEEDLRREKLRTALREWQEQQAADPTPHELALNEETDLVCCGRCKRSAAARTWRSRCSPRNFR